MYQPRLRWPVVVLLTAAIAVALILFTLVGVSGKTHYLASVAQREKDCTQAAKEYSQFKHDVPGTIIAIVGHYNERLHRCLVEISSERDENDAKSYYDEVVDPKTDRFIASRTRDVGQQGRRDSTIVMGAPVRIDDQAGAQSWFEGLMK